MKEPRGQQPGRGGGLKLWESHTRDRLGRPSDSAAKLRPGYRRGDGSTESRRRCADANPNPPL